MDSVSKDEVKGVLKKMQRDKIPEPDGWKVKFF